MKTSARLTIFEGPDGSGKTTAAIAYARTTGAHYVHFPSLPRVSRNLGRMYVEAMLPALLGYQDVVFDRSWLSEMPYGIAFREGRDRLTSASRRMLERLAMRCGAVVIQCNPGWETVRSNFLSRKHLEMLDDDNQLKMVYDLYTDQVSDLPTVMFDYRRPVAIDAIEPLRMDRHPLGVSSAGNWGGRLVLVGETFAERKDCDAFYQWPFGSFSNEGCSQWLTDVINLVDVGEDDILWVNADQDLEFLYDLKQPVKIIALGAKAYEKLYKLKISAHSVPHPQAWKRFNNGQQYPLLDLI